MLHRGDLRQGPASPPAQDPRCADHVHQGPQVHHRADARGVRRAKVNAEGDEWGRRGRRLLGTARSVQCRAIVFLWGGGEEGMWSGVAAKSDGASIIVRSCGVSRRSSLLSHSTPPRTHAHPCDWRRTTERERGGGRESRDPPTRTPANPLLSSPAHTSRPPHHHHHHNLRSHAQPRRVHTLGPRVFFLPLAERPLKPPAVGRPIVRSNRVPSTHPRASPPRGVRARLCARRHTIRRNANEGGEGFAGGPRAHHRLRSFGSVTLKSLRSLTRSLAHSPPHPAYSKPRKHNPRFVTLSTRPGRRTALRSGRCTG